MERGGGDWCGEGVGNNWYFEEIGRTVGTVAAQFLMMLHIYHVFVKAAFKLIIAFLLVFYLEYLLIIFGYIS